MSGSTQTASGDMTSSMLGRPPVNLSDRIGVGVDLEHLVADRGQTMRRHHRLPQKAGSECGGDIRWGGRVSVSTPAHIGPTPVTFASMVSGIPHRQGGFRPPRWDCQVAASACHSEIAGRPAAVPRSSKGQNRNRAQLSSRARSQPWLTSVISARSPIISRIVVGGKVHRDRSRLNLKALTLLDLRATMSSKPLGLRPLA